MFNIKKIGDCEFLIEKTGGMLVPGLVIATDEMMQKLEMEKALEQVVNVAHLPGIVGYSIAMPDIHWGYGFPIGGIAAMDMDHGVISPGGVGYDINCGVRLAVVDIPFDSIDDKRKKELLKAIYAKVPSGVGKGQKEGQSLTNKDFHDIAVNGVNFALNHGYGIHGDKEHIESYGVIANGDISFVSNIAKERGARQLGTIGSGNHFVEIGKISDLYLEDIAAKWGITQGMTYVMIHSGSRGFGHQICQDTLDEFMQKGFAKYLPDPQLVAAPIQSNEGKQYLSAMACAANFAFNNRQVILHEIRQAFKEVFHLKPEEIRLIYDVCHNIAKMEEHIVDEKKRKLCVHRKGATRAYGPHHKELAPLFQETGQPVMVPGDMGRASFILVGEGNPKTFCSACHGAGREKSRIASLKMFKGKDLIQIMNQQDVKVMASNARTIAEEMPEAYKDVKIVVEATQRAHLAKIVAKLKPHLVVKG